MKKTYRSKVEIAVLFPVVIVLLAAEVFMLFNQFWILAAVIALVSLFLLYMYMETGYELTGDEKLKIKSGFLYHKEIYVKSIKKVRQTRDSLASPALSLDRIEILYNRYDRVLISPNQRSEFISRLQKVNPRILVS
jgi:hypothetical protein